jgi:hypothetical protein
VNGRGGVPPAAVPWRRRKRMRRGVRVAEGARLESVCAGNCTAGSNPALSANVYEGCQGLVFRGRASVLRPGRLERRGRVRSRGGRVGGWCAGARVRPRGWVDGGREAGCMGVERGGGRLGGGSVRGAGVEAQCSRHPALSANLQSHLRESRVVSQPCEAGPSRKRWRPNGGKQGARVPRDGAPRTSSGPEGSSDKGIATGAAVSPGSFLHHLCRPLVVPRCAVPGARCPVPGPGGRG